MFDLTTGARLTPPDDDVTRWEEQLHALSVRVLAEVHALYPWDAVGNNPGSALRFLAHRSDPGDIATVRRALNTGQFRTSKQNASMVAYSDLREAADWALCRMQGIPTSSHPSMHVSPHFTGALRTRLILTRAPRHTDPPLTLTLEPVEVDRGEARTAAVRQTWELDLSGFMGYGEYDWPASEPLNIAWPWINTGTYRLRVDWPLEQSDEQGDRPRRAKPVETGTTAKPFVVTVGEFTEVSELRVGPPHEPVEATE